MTTFAAISDWGFTALSGNAHVTPPFWAFWHARMMVVGWSILIPMGMLIARFFKIMPRQNWPEVLDNPRWWRLHVSIQSLGIAVMTLGVLLALPHVGGDTPIAVWHRRMGWGIVIIGWLQIAGGYFRGSKGGPTKAELRGDHYDMTRRRLVFEYVHKFLGWIALPFVVLTTAAGLVMLDAPRWMAVLIGVWWLAFAIALVFLQASGRCIDTYQAIWGPDPLHPGNQRKPIGLWVSRRPHVVVSVVQPGSERDGNDASQPLAGNG